MCYSIEIAPNAISLHCHNAHYPGIYKFLVTLALHIPTNTFGFKNLNHYTTVAPLQIATKKAKSLLYTEKKNKNSSPFIMITYKNQDYQIKNPKVPKRLSY